jgi:hypothetical protein
MFEICTSITAPSNACSASKDTDRSVAVGGWVHHDGVKFFTCLLDPCDQFAFIIGLFAGYVQTQIGTNVHAVLFNIGKCFVPINFGLTFAQHVDVGTV